MKTPSILHSAVLALALGLLLPGAARPASAQTWQVSPISGNWNTAGNWTAGGPPSDLATFGSTATTAIFNTSGAELNSILFTAAASAYTITTNPASWMSLSGAGITNNSAVTQNFVAAVDTLGSNGGIYFYNSATAGTNTAFTANGASDANAYTYGGQIGFFNTSAAGHGTFTTNGGTDYGTGAGATYFKNSSTAANATFITNGATSSGANGGSVVFGDNSTAANASFTTTGATVSGANSGMVEFDAASTAANAIFTNSGGAVSGVNGGAVVFTATSTAANSTFTNHGGTVNGASGGTISFLDSSTAANATITNNGGTASGAYGSVLQFNATSTADNATLTSNGGTASGATGAYTFFVDTATAGNATLIANGGTNGGWGGLIAFQIDSTGGTSQVEVFGNGALDISNHTGPGVAVGSVEGTGNVYLGANTLTTGGNNRSTNISGVIQDGGLNGGSGGSLTKTGTGTLTLAGDNTYTGSTAVSSGELVVNGNIGTSSGVSVASGAILSGHGSVSLISGSGLVSPGNSPGILTATQVDPTGGLSFNFQFTLATPTYSNSASSGNDVLRLTNATPFLASLTGSNTITLDFTGQTLHNGDFVYGGFFTDTAVADSMVNGANFVYTNTGGATVQFDGFSPVSSASFADGAVNGNIMKFGVVSDVPEPSTVALLIGSFGTLALLRRRRSGTAQ